MSKNSLFTYTIFLCAALFLVLPLSAQTFSWKKLGTATETKCLNLTVGYDGSILAGTDRGVLRSFDNGITWQKCGLDSFEVGCVALDSTGRLFAGGGKMYGKKGVYISEDSGKTWKLSIAAIDSSIPNLLYRVTSILSVTNEIVVAGTDGFGILRSTNHGGSWSRIAPLATEKYIASLCMTADGYLYAGSYGTIVRSTNQGVTWFAKAYINFPHLLTPGKDSDVFVFAMENDGYSSIYHSTNKGNTWLQFGLRGLAVRGIVQDSYGKLFVCLFDDTVAVMSREAASSTWKSTKTDTSFRSCTSIVLTPDGHCLVGLWSGGLYRSIDVVTSVDQTPITYPLSSMLSQNYPNPFNPSTEIEYQIPQGEFVTLRIYDMLGREIASLVNEWKNGGRYSVRWNGSGFSSGVYLAKMRAGNFISTKKLMLMK